MFPSSQEIAPVLLSVTLAAGPIVSIAPFPFGKLRVPEAIQLPPVSVVPDRWTSELLMKIEAPDCTSTVPILSRGTLIEKEALVTRSVPSLNTVPAVDPTWPPKPTELLPPEAWNTPPGLMFMTPGLFTR